MLNGMVRNGNIWIKLQDGLNERLNLRNNGPNAVEAMLNRQRFAFYIKMLERGMKTKTNSFISLMAPILTAKPPKQVALG